MGSIEHTGRESTHQEHNVPIDSPEAQGALMLFEYQAAHCNEPVPPKVDWVHLEQNDLDVESAARDEWVEGDPSFASVYRALIDENPGAVVDIHDETVLTGLLTKLTEEKKARTLH